MAEMVGLVAAIGSIIGAGYKITKAISAAREDIGAAEASVQAIATDMAFVTMILGQIRDRLNSIRVVEVETLKILEGILLQCKTDIDAIEKTLLPIIANVKAGGFKSKRQRIRFLFARSKLCTQRATLGSLKLTLSLFIHTLQLSDGYDVEILKDEILDAISKSKETKTIFLNAERVDHAVAKACEIHDRTSIPENSSAGTAALSIEDADRPVLPGRAITLPAFQAAEPGADMVDLNSDPANWELQLRSASEFEVMQTISDDSFMKIAEHMRLQKSVATFALGTMEPGPRPTDIRKPSFELNADRDEGVSLQDGYSAESSPAESIARADSEERRSSIREGKQPEYPSLFDETSDEGTPGPLLNPGKRVPSLSTERQSEAETVVDTAGSWPPSNEPARKQDLRPSEEDGQSYALATDSGSTPQADSTPQRQPDTDVLTPAKIKMGNPQTTQAMVEEINLRLGNLREKQKQKIDELAQRAAAGMDQEALLEKARKQTEETILREMERINKAQPTVEERMARMQAEAEIERRHQEELIRVREEAWEKASAQYKLRQYRGIEEPQRDTSAAKTVKGSKRKKFRQLLGLGRSSKRSVIVSG